MSTPSENPTPVSAGVGALARQAGFYWARLGHCFLKDQRVALRITTQMSPIDVSMKSLDSKLVINCRKIYCLVVV